MQKITISVNDLRGMLSKYLERHPDVPLSQLSIMLHKPSNELYHFLNGASGNSGTGAIIETVKKILDLEDETEIVPYYHVSDLSVPIKNRLCPEALLELESINECRKSNGLRMIEIKTVTCVGCSHKFESTGRRFCTDCTEIKTKATEAMSSSYTMPNWV